MRMIPQRELRNHISQILREVEAGARLRITVDGRPVADLVPVNHRQEFVPRDQVLDILRRASLDSAFERELDDATSETIDDL